MGSSIFGFVYESIPWGMIFFVYTFIFIDLFYGILVAWITGDTKSHKMLIGIRNKIFVMFIPICGILILTRP